MLLTSSQISMGLSSAIVFVFSTILFLSGYLLQQQTVHELQAILKPPEPALPRPTPNSRSETVDWNSVAYVQIISRHEDVCAAAVIFAELAKRGSKADRVLLYPRSWEREEKRESDEDRRSRERNMRLLRKVVARYGIVMKAVDGERQNVADLAAADTTIPVQKLFSLTEWQTLAYLAPPGVVYNTTALDEVFAFDMTSPQLDFWTKEAMAQEELRDESQLIATLIRPNPSKPLHVEMLRRPGMDMATIAKLLGSESKFNQNLFGGTGSLKRITTEYEDGEQLRAAYMRFSDSSIPGPEYNIPQELWDSSRPETRQGRLAWEKVYADYRERRRTVCGLEVEPMPKTLLETGQSSEDYDKELKASL